ISLRSVVVGQNGKVISKNDCVSRCFLSSKRCQPSRPGREASNLHRLGAARQLPQQFVAAAQRVRRAWGGRRLEGVGELDAIDNFVIEGRTCCDMELITVAVARAQSMVSLTRLMERIE